MKVLVTGGTGFLGRRAAQELARQGHDVLVISRSAPGNPSGGVARAAFATVEEAGRLVRGFEPQVVLHAASAQGRDGESVVDMVRANHLLGLAVLDATAARPATFINFDTTLPPRLNAYAFTKQQFRDAVRYFRPPGARVINLRLQTLYGPGDSESKFTTHVIRAFLAGAPHLDMTPGEQQRDFLYLDDAVSALGILVAAHESFGSVEEIDLGSGEAVALMRFVEIARDAAAAATQIRPCLPYRGNESMHMVADISRLAGLGWRPGMSLVEGIRETVRQERRDQEGET